MEDHRVHPVEGDVDPALADDAVAADDPVGGQDEVGGGPAARSDADPRQRHDEGDDAQVVDEAAEAPAGVPGLAEQQAEDQRAEQGRRRQGQEQPVRAEVEHDLLGVVEERGREGHGRSLRPHRPVGW
ncbi:MAG: hypothetical protein R2702_19315 [Acidimicrobiales bacterium]